MSGYQFQSVTLRADGDYHQQREERCDSEQISPMSGLNYKPRMGHVRNRKQPCNIANQKAAEGAIPHAHKRDYQPQANTSYAKELNG